MITTCQLDYQLDHLHLHTHNRKRGRNKSNFSPSKQHNVWNQLICLLLLIHTYIYLSILTLHVKNQLFLPIIYGLIIILGGWNGGKEEINVGVVTEIHSHFEQFFKPICHATSLWRLFNININKMLLSFLLKGVTNDQ